MLGPLHLDWFEKTNLRSGATKTCIERVQQEAGVGFPPEYVSFIETSDGYEGSIGEGYVQLWLVQELLETNNGYGFGINAPGYFAIGADGGGESFGFHVQSKRFFMIPFIATGWDDAIEVGLDFNELLTKLHDNKLFGGR
jgi:hypothetical protein